MLKWAGVHIVAGRLAYHSHIRFPPHSISQARSGLQEAALPAAAPVTLTAEPGSWTRVRTYVALLHRFQDYKCRVGHFRFHEAALAHVVEQRLFLINPGLVQVNRVHEPVMVGQPI